MARLFEASMPAIAFNRRRLFAFGAKLASPADASIITATMPLIAFDLYGLSLK